MSLEPEPSKGCLDCFMDELKPENVAPIHDNSRLFVDSQWTIGRMSTAYVVYRVVVSIALIVWAVADCLDESGRFYRQNYAIWFIFATNWSLLAICLQAAWMATTSVYYYYHTRYRYSEFPTPIGLGLRAQWILYSMATNSAVVVTISFWSFIIIYVENDLSWFIMTPMSQLKHSLNTIYVIVDLLVNAVPVRVYHVIYPLLFGLVYTLFNVLYFVGGDGLGPDGHPYTYDVMDWRNPLGSTITVLVGFVLTFVVQFLLYGCYCARLAAHRRLTVVMAPDAAVRYRPSTTSTRIHDESPLTETNALSESEPICQQDAAGRNSAGYKALDHLDRSTLAE